MLGEAKDAGLGNGQDTQSRAWTGMAHWRMPGGRCRCVPRQQQYRKQTRYGEEGGMNIQTCSFSRNDGIIAVVVLCLWRCGRQDIGGSRCFESSAQRQLVADG